jgi:acyl-CoA synthetase (AMP-forming)/AMP-acid ligase II
MTAYLNLSSPSDQTFLTLLDLLSYRANQQPEQTAYTFLNDGETKASHLTYRDLELQVRAVAAHLQSQLAPRRRALLLYQPGLDFLVAFFGCLYAGVVAVPAYPPRRNQQYMSRLHSILENAQTHVALTSSHLLEDAKRFAEEDPRLAHLQWIATDQIEAEIAASWREPEVSGESLAFLQYTSGSTGMPKGVMISHANLLHNSAVIYNCFAHTAESRGVIWLPPYHDMGLIGGILQPLYGGFPVTLMSPTDFLQKPFRWLQAISRDRATTSGGPNFAYELLIRKATPERLANLDLSCWEVAFTGAEPVRAQTLERFAETFAPCGFRKEAFYPCYGMAETVLIVSGGLKTVPPVVCDVETAALEEGRVAVPTNKHQSSRKVVGCGQTWLNHHVIIVDPQSLTRCEANQVGEIWVSGPSIAQGYWNRPDETQRTFQSYLANTQEGPFLRTGDLGFLHNGELYITGRLKDVIIIRGQNHYPQDIELTVEQSHLALRPGCGAAFSVEVKGEERLVVVQEVERSFLRDLDANQVVTSIRQAVAEEHDLQVYATVLLKTGSIPKTSSGKIRRQACRADFLNRELNVVEDWSENPRGKTKFVSLETDVTSILHQLSTSKQG